MPGKIDLKALSSEGLDSFCREFGLPRYRASQLRSWIYEKYAVSLDEITEFSKDLRARLSESAYISGLGVRKHLVSHDGAEKFLFSLEDGETVESVLIPEEDRLTLCISSQVGCAMGCGFCRTAEMGLVRNLKAHEIIDQILSVNRIIGPDRRVSNVVMMGMGEPLANLDEVSEALRRMLALLGMSRRRITVSTSGLVPRMALFGRSAPDVNLAVSLNASTDRVRDEIMPVNKKYPLNSLIEACRRYPLGPQRRITFEYVMIGGVNDSEEDARRLPSLLKGIRCKLNLIPLNPHEGSPFKRPSDERVLGFQKILAERGMTALIRKSRGEDIMAACGQLKAEHLRKDEKEAGKNDV